MGSLGKNRVFEKEGLQELKEAGDKVLEEAIRISEEFMKEAKQLQALYEQVPGECRDMELPGLLAAQSAICRTDSYELMKEKLDRTIEKLTEEVPAQDRAAAETQKTAAGACRQAQAALEGMTGLLEEGILYQSYDSFTVRLTEHTAEWKEKTPLLEEKLEAAAIALRGKVETAPFSPDPVNLATGNLVLTEHDLPDIPWFARTYNSMGTRKGAMGRGWMHGQESRLEIKEEKEILSIEEDGREQKYKKFADGIYLSEDTGDYLEEGPEGYLRLDRKGTLHYYDSSGRTIKKQEENGRILSFQYEEEGKTIKIKEENGTELELLYTGTMLMEVKTPDGRSIRYRYDGRRLSGTSDRTGKGRSYQYDEKRRLSRHTDGEGNRTAYGYDSHGRCTDQTLPDNSTMHFSYDDDRNETVFTDREGRKWRYRFNVGQDLQEIRSEETGERMRIPAAPPCQPSLPPVSGATLPGTPDEKDDITDGNGNLCRKKLTDGSILEASYDSLRQPEEITLHGKNLKIERDARLRPGTIRDEKGEKMIFRYHMNGRLKQLEHRKADDTPDWKTEYDTDGNLTACHDETGLLGEYHYDETGRPIKVTEAGYGITIIRYSPDNSRAYLEKEKDDGEKYILTADHTPPPNKIHREKWPDTLKEGPLTVTYRYEKDGRLSERIFGGKIHEKRAYDKKGRLKHLKISAGEQTLEDISYEYDSRGYLQKEQRNGSTAEYIHDRAGRLEEIIREGKKECRYRYDTDGNRKEKETEEGTTLYRHDSTGRLEEILTPDGKRHFQETEASGQDTAEENDRKVKKDP